MWRAVTFGLLALLALPAAAAAAGAPPGLSEADQYSETLPAAPGPRAPGSPKAPQDAVREGRLSPTVERALDGRGTVGQAVAKAVAKTAPVGSGGRRAAGPLAERARVPGKQGLGAAFPLALLAAAAAAAAFALNRRRSSAR